MNAYSYRFTSLNEWFIDPRCKTSALLTKGRGIETASCVFPHKLDGIDCHKSDTFSLKQLVVCFIMFYFFILKIFYHGSVYEKNRLIVLVRQGSDLLGVRN